MPAVETKKATAEAKAKAKAEELVAKKANAAQEAIDDLRTHLTTLQPKITENPPKEVYQLKKFATATAKAIEQYDDAVRALKVLEKGEPKKAVAKEKVAS